MRLVEIEKPLKEAVSQYIKEIYPYERGELPSIEVLDAREFGKKTGIIGKAAYNFRENIIYFSERPTPLTVAHEIHHWAQCQRVGMQKYWEQLKELKAYYLPYEKEADDVALKNAPKLKWGWPTK